jgi:hypothetical protein
MMARGMDTDDARLVKLIAKRVGCCLRGQRDAGLAMGEDGRGQIMAFGLGGPMRQPVKVPLPKNAKRQYHCVCANLGF